MNRWTGSLAAAAILALAAAPSAHALGRESFIVHEAGQGAVALAHAGRATPIYADAKDFPGVLRAVGDLQQDIARV